jgi:hypothetical protein
VQYAIRVLDDGVTTWLLLEADEAATLLPWLDRMRFMLRVELADRSADFATIGTLGADLVTPDPPLLTPAAPNGVPLVWRDPWSAVQSGGHQYAEASEHPGGAWSYREVLVPRAPLAAASAPASTVASTVASAPAPAVPAAVPAAVSAAGTLALEALRIAAWRPRAATEVDEKTIPHELDWLRSAVHLNKGCYRGQETVAKVHNLGHPPRRLVFLHLDGSDAVHASHGDEVTLDGAVVGRVTSAALHFELGPIALAVVKRTVDPAAALTVIANGTALAAAQETIVPTDAGAEANVPRLPRLGSVPRER